MKKENMVKIIKVIQEEGETPKFLMAIEPKVMPLLIEAGITALLNQGALEFISMTQEQFKEHKDKETDPEENAKQEAEMWGEFLKNAASKDLPQA